MKNSPQVLFLVLILVCSAFTAKNDCSGTNPRTKKKYDFNKLVVDNGYSVQFKQGNDVYNMIVNPCNQVGGRAQCTEGSCSICQQKDDGSHWNCGTADKSDFAWYDLGSGYAGEEGIVLHVAGGLQGRNSNISFICDETKGGGTPDPKSENMQTKTYIFEWKTAYACNAKPTNQPRPTPSGSPNKHNSDKSGGGLSGGSIMMIIVAVLVVVYLGGGMAFNKFVRHQDNFVEMIPNREFWMTIPGLVKDGVMLVVNRIRGRTAYAQL